MTQTTPTNPNRWRSIIANGLVILVIVLIFPVLTVTWFWWQTGELPQLFESDVPQIPPDNVLETIVIPMNATGPIITESQYNGKIRLVIEGYVQADSGDLMDVFYRYANAQGEQFEPPLPADEVLQIDGQPISQALGIEDALPKYTPFHVYEVVYDLGVHSRQLTFAAGSVDLPPDTEYRIGVFVVPYEDSPGS